MDIRYSGKNMRVTKDIKEHLEDRIGKLDKFSPKIVESHVVVSKEKHSYVAQVSILGKNFQAHSEGNHKENVYGAIDQAVDRIQKQVKKHREKVKDHYQQHGEYYESPKEKTARKIMEKGLQSKAPFIVKMPASETKPMSVEDASMELEMGSHVFFVFINAKSKKLNVIFKLADGNHGLIQP